MPKDLGVVKYGGRQVFFFKVEVVFYNSLKVSIIYFVFHRNVNN